MIDPVYLIFAGFTGLAALLAAIAIHSPKATAIRATAVGVTACFVVLAYLGLNEILARPKFVGHEWFNAHAKQATVLGVSLDEGRAIYLWLRVDNSFEPRFYKLPWQQQNAEKLQTAIDRAIEEDAVVRIFNPFSRKSWTNEGAINLEIVRPPVPPLKHPPPPPRIYNPREHLTWSLLTGSHYRRTAFRPGEPMRVRIEP